MTQYVFILGRTHLLSIAELCSFFNENEIKEIQKGFLIVELDSPLKDPEKLQDSLGGTIKICKIIKTLENKENLEEEIKKILQKHFVSAKTKVAFGISTYNLAKSYENILKKLLKNSKKFLKSAGIKSRFVNKNCAKLTSVQIKKENLISEKGLEINIIQGSKIYLAKTITVQNFENYSKRDYEKPARDARSGMMPPKVAQMMINLGITRLDIIAPAFVISTERSEWRDLPKVTAGSKEISRGCPRISNNELKSIFVNPVFRCRDARFCVSTTVVGQPVEMTNQMITDPFCGTGTVLMEALLMGYNAVGSDISKKAIEASKKNLKWLKENFGKKIPGDFKVIQQDATKLQITEKDFTIVTEPYLGPPLTFPPTEERINEIQKELTDLYIEFFKKLKNQIPKNTNIVIIFPYIKAKNKKYFLGITTEIEKLGFEAQDLIPKNIQEKFSLKLTDHKSLLYERKKQIVGREIWRFVKR